LGHFWARRGAKRRYDECVHVFFHAETKKEALRRKTARHYGLCGTASSLARLFSALLGAGGAGLMWGEGTREGNDAVLSGEREKERVNTAAQDGSANTITPVYLESRHHRVAGERVGGGRNRGKSVKPTFGRPGI
jgi:hypothetical protein